MEKSTFLAKLKIRRKKFITNRYVGRGTDNLLGVPAGSQAGEATPRAGSQEREVQPRRSQALGGKTEQAQPQDHPPVGPRAGAGLGVSGAESKARLAVRWHHIYP